VDVEQGGGLVLVLLAWRVVWVPWGQPVASPRGQAQGPRIHPTAPLVPTGCSPFPHSVGNIHQGACSNCQVLFFTLNLP